MFFTYRQNNSGGRFQIDTAIRKYVIVEARTAREANELAENIGLYFDGYGDCECCGRRWSEQYDNTDGTKVPEVYGRRVKAVRNAKAKDAAEVIIYYKNGRVTYGDEPW